MSRLEVEEEEQTCPTHANEMSNVTYGRERVALCVYREREGAEVGEADREESDQMYLEDLPESGGRGVTNNRENKVL